MANVQSYFESFDRAIRLGRFDENGILREKRDIIRERVDADLAEVFESYGENVPEWSWRDQGSYELGTGIKPPAGSQIDIDQGLYIDIDPTEWDPVEIKERVHEVLDGHTKKVRIRRPCVTVWYHKSGEEIFHVDIAVYAKGSSWSASRIAMGKLYSSDDNRSWDISDPQGLIDAVYDRFPSGADRDQFRRVVRALKRWKDLNFSGSGNEAPLGVALTVCAYYGLQVQFADPFAKSGPDDRSALLGLVRWIRSRITEVWDGDHERFTRQIRVELPVQPYNDLFVRMTPSMTERLDEKLAALETALLAAEQEIKPEAACQELAAVFGSDFPVPEVVETARVTRQAYSRSGSSA